MSAHLLALPLPQPAQTRSQPATTPHIAPVTAPAVSPSPRRTREVWLALHLRGWQLHAALCALTADERRVLVSQPLAVVDDDRRATILTCNELAAASGVRSGHSMNAAIALCAHLQFLPRVPESEAKELETLAGFCDRYTPKVSPAPPDELLVEVRGSMKLFGGLSSLIEKISNDLQALQMSAQIAVTPTPQSALWFARVAHRHIVRPRELIPTLTRLPIQVLCWPPQIEQRLARFGVVSIGDLLRLPRAGLARRIGHEHLAQLDHATGRFRELRSQHRTLTPYHDRVLLDFEIQTTGLLATVIDRRFKDLDRYLRTRAAATDRVAIELKHREAPLTRVEIGLASATSDISHISRLMHEHLGRVALPAPVIELSLRVERYQPQPQRSVELFKAQSHASAIPNTEPQARLLEELRARLGTDAIRSLSAHSDFRPDVAQHESTASIETKLSIDTPPADLAPRPLWFLRQPRRISRTQASRLQCEHGPEKIDAGWWDGAPVDREYYVSRSRSGARLWTFRDCRNSALYVHGLFG